MNGRGETLVICNAYVNRQLSDVLAPVEKIWKFFFRGTTRDQRDMGLVGAKFESQVSVRLEVDLMRRIEGLISSRSLGPWCEKPSEAIRVVLAEVFRLIDADSLHLGSDGLQVNTKNGLSRMNAKKAEGGKNHESELS